MINQLKIFLRSTAAAICLFAILPSAQATPTLYVNGTAVASGPFIFYANDNVAGGWDINVTVALATGTTSPYMMVMFDVFSAGAGTLTLGFSADFFGPTNGLMTGSFSSTVNPADPLSTVTFSTLVSDTNTLNAGVPLFGDQVLGTGASNTSASAPLNLPASYSLTQIVTIVHGIGGGSSGTYTLAATVPEAGSTLCCMVMALGGLVALRRRLS